ncbi:hypothetical protein ACN6LK_000515 [Streptomyces griseus]|uniref:hypothetical protein n=1 Tax=Streptomyces griseus TaxID=1911 RepID=UPI00403C3FB9
MVDLLVLDESVGPTAATQPVTSFGGLPAVPDGTAFAWPRCDDVCDEPMQYIGKVVDPNAPAEAPRLVLLFLCANPDTLGGCETWDAEAGANAAILVPAAAALETVPAPPEGVTTRDTFYGTRVESFEIPERAVDPDFDTRADDYGDAVLAWRAAHPGEPDDRKVLGTWGGGPAWLQWPEPPSCPSCDAPMALVANLEEGPGHRTDANFGGGRGHLFSCACEQSAARFLWQQ